MSENKTRGVRSSVAWSNYRKTDEYWKSSNPLTLKAPKNQKEFLENRLLLAFIAGFQAGDDNA